VQQLRNHRIRGAGGTRLPVAREPATPPAPVAPCRRYLFGARRSRAAPHLGAVCEVDGEPQWRVRVAVDPQLPRPHSDAKTRKCVGQYPFG
jgi:hypothetical protein